MPEVFELVPEFGLSVSYEFKNDVHETMMGVDYINARWMYPVAKYSFKVAFFKQSVYEYLRDFFLFVNGSQDSFLFQDPINDYCSPPGTEQSQVGIDVRGKLVDIGGGVFQLCKEWRIGEFVYSKPIKYPNEVTITQADYSSPVSATINYETGQVTGAVNNTMGWYGTFYTPVRFDNDSVPLEIISYNTATGEQTYAVPDLRLIEVKDYPAAPPVNIATNLNHYWNLSFPINSTFNFQSKTDIFTSDSGFEARDELNSYKRELNFSYSKINYFEKEYILGLWFLTLGGWATIKFGDIEADIDTTFRFIDTPSFTSITQPLDTYAVQFGLNDILFKAENIVLKETISLLRNSYCQAWIITRNDGVVQGFINHDLNKIIEGTECVALLGFTGTPSQRTAELNTDTTELSSIFLDINVTEDDLITGKYDNAGVVVYLYDWLSNSLVTTQFRGSIGGYSVGYLPSKAKQYQMEVLSIAEKLDVNVASQTSSECRHKFLSQGYGRCNRPTTETNTTDAGLPQIKATVGAVNALDNISVPSPATDNWVGFKYGVLKFLTGTLAGTEIYIADTAHPNQVIFLYPLPTSPTVGDEVLLTRNCSKTVDACNGFGNIANFGGFPRLPGIDNLVAGADL